MADSSKVLTTITGYFNDNYSTVNKYFQGQVHANDAEYVEINVASLDADFAELTGDTTGIEDVGMIRVNCYADLALGGMVRATAIAQSVKPLFDHVLITGTANVQCETGYVQHVGYNETLQRYEMLYVCPYYGK
jgi:hypothetical protein